MPVGGVSGRIGVADRAGGPTGPEPLRVSAKGAHPLRAWLRNRWRKFNRNPLMGDLRLIQLQHWPKYRQRIETGCVGYSLQALFEAYHNGHLRSQRRK